MGQGMLALARHDFQAGLQWGQKAREANPFRAQILGVLVDAHTELGQYEEAVAMAQEMIDLRPDLASYSRVSYLRELHGDLNGAIGAMEMAVAAGLPSSESWAWTQVQLGHLFLNKGDVDKAEAIYEEALYYRQDYPYALGGLARVQAARGNHEAAIEILRPLVERLPLPEFAILLGDLYTANQQPEVAQQQYDLVKLIQQLNEQAGVSVDLELALFEADHGQPATAVQKARVAYQARPSILAADVLSWALYQDGHYEEAWVYAQEALRLGTQDALLHYHAGKIAQALGDARQAQTYLEKALTINPTFSILYAPDAQATLANYSS
jgi:tetratricopeptide (TPR) repeat protein